jgi:phosphomevalonate kinase
MLIIGLSGKMGSGKDFIASNYIIPFLKDHLKLMPLKMAFSDQLKVNVMTKHNISFTDVYMQKTDNTRQLLQIEGTENGRERYGKDVWIRHLDAWANVYKTRGIDAIVLSDVRFVNEVQYIKSNGGLVVRVNAPQRNEMRLQNDSGGDNEIYNKIKLHPSECELDAIGDSMYDFIVNNDDQTRTEMDVNKILSFLGLYFKTSGPKNNTFIL